MKQFIAFFKYFHELSQNSNIIKKSAIAYIFS